MFTDATSPNSFITVLSVNIKVAKPSAVVVLVSKVALPTFVIILEIDFILFP